MLKKYSVVILSLLLVMPWFTNVNRQITSPKTVALLSEDTNYDDSEIVITYYY